MKVVCVQLLTGLALLWLSSGSGSVWAQGVSGRGRAIQFSEPKVPVVTSNLNHAASSKNSSLRSLDEQFKTPFNILESADPASLSDRPVPFVIRPSLDPRTVRRLADKKAEQEQWIFGSPEELEAQRLSAERMFGVTEYDENGAEKTVKTPFQRYWDRMEREQGRGQTNRLAEVFTEKSDDEIKAQARTIFGLGPSNSETEEQESQSTIAPSAPTATLLIPAPTSPLLTEFSSSRISGDWFNSPPPAMSAAKSEAAVNRMNEFKQLFDVKAAAASPVAGNSLGTSPMPPLNRPVSGADFAPTPVTTWRPPSLPAAGFDTTVGAGLGKPFGIPATGLNPTPQPLVPPPRATPPPVGFQIPRRSF